MELQRWAIKRVVQRCLECLVEFLSRSMLIIAEFAKEHNEHARCEQLRRVINHASQMSFRVAAINGGLLKTNVAEGNAIQ